MKNNDEQWEQVWRSAKEHPIYRGCAVILVGSTIALLLGFAFLIIFQALLFGTVFIGIYWPLTYHWLKKTFFPTSFYPDIDHIPMRWGQVILLPIKLGFVGYMLFVGIDILLTRGFLGQNLIWAILK